MPKIRIEVKKGKIIGVMDVSSSPISKYEKLRRAVTRKRDMQIKYKLEKLNAPIIFPKWNE